MITFFSNHDSGFYAVGHDKSISPDDLSKLAWLFGGDESLSTSEINGEFIGPRKEMISPWSTNAVEITQNMGIHGIDRIEEFKPKSSLRTAFDPMLQAEFSRIDQQIFTVSRQPDPIQWIEDIGAYNEQEGFALNDQEVQYLEGVSQNLGRKLSDSEVFGFSQVNSEHCRHKIFNGKFIINDQPQDKSLFDLIRETAKANGNNLVSAYKDNVAFVKGPTVNQFAPISQNKAEFFRSKSFESVLSLKAETHNFPTTVEPFYGASTGTGGEIRDRLAGGKASVPLAGTAVYMTSYPRLDRPWPPGDRRHADSTLPRIALFSSE